MTKIIENKLSSDDEQKFDVILQLLFENEFFNDVGKANMMISQHSYDYFCQEYGIQKKDVSQLTTQEVRIFYRTIYQNSQCHYLQDPQLAYAYFDSAIKLQAKDAVEILQRAIGGGLEVDGKMGKTTLIKANSMDPKYLALQLIRERKNFQQELFKVEPSLKLLEEDWNDSLDEITEIINDGVISDRLARKISGLPYASNLMAEQGRVEEETLKYFDFHLDLPNLNRIKGVDMKNGRFLLDDKENIFLSDLVTVLSVYGDDSIKPEHKVIQFSFDPILEPNSDEFYFQEKVCFPDKIVNRNVIQDTELAKIMFESDYLMKLMGLGIESDGKTPFQYPEQLSKLGLKSCLDFGTNHSGKSVSRKWLSPQECTYSYKNDQYILNDVQVICQARQLGYANSKLQDRVVQDENNFIYQFALKFTELYDQIATYYPIFNRLKSVFKAVALGKWMYENKIKIDFKQMMAYNKKVDNNPKIIPIIKNTRKTETLVYKTEAQKIETAKEILKELGLSELEDQKDIIDIFVPHVDDRLGYHIEIEYVKGGIDSMCRKMEQINWPVQNQVHSIFDQVQIPFLRTQKCQDCSRKIANSIFDKCGLHNDKTCFGCLDLVVPSNGQVPKIMSIINQQYAFHNQCYDDHLRKDHSTDYRNRFKEQTFAKQEQQMHNNNRFENILGKVLEHEGGKSNHKNDRGGKTYKGITQKNYNQDQQERGLQAKDVYKLTKKDVKDYYKWKYETFKVDKIQNPDLAYVYFDFAVHSGYTRAARTLQKIIGVQVDGVVGSITQNQLNTLDDKKQKEIAFKLLEERKKFLNEFCDNNSEQEIMRKGFNNRVDKIKEQISGQGIEQNLGGIDCTPEVNQLNKIKGVSKLNPKFLIDSQENINISDLSTALSVFLDPNIPEQQKQISFSLDPIILLNDPEFYEQEKVCWPDKFVQRNIIQDTELAQVMFESDFLLKQMSLGLSEDGIIPFEYPMQLSCLGLKPYFEFKDQKMNDQRRLFRFLLVPQECTYQNKNDQFIIDDIKVMCKSQSMERIGNTLQDKSQQSQDDCASQFAAKFTEIYDIIAQHYPIFNRLKQLFKAVILGKWISLNYHSIDFQQLKPFIKQVNNNPKQIPVVKVKHEREDSRVLVHLTEEEKIEQAKDYLKRNQNSLTVDNINQLLVNFTDAKGYLVKRSTYYAYGGVDANCYSFKEQSSSFIENEEIPLQVISIPFINFKCSAFSRIVEEKYFMDINSTNCSIHHEQTFCSCRLGFENNNVKDLKYNVISETQGTQESIEQIQKKIKKN